MSCGTHIMPAEEKYLNRCSKAIACLDNTSVIQKREIFRIRTKKPDLTSIWTVADVNLDLKGSDVQLPSCRVGTGFESSHVIFSKCRAQQLASLWANIARAFWNLRLIYLNPKFETGLSLNPTKSGPEKDVTLRTMSLGAKKVHFEKEQLYTVVRRMHKASAGDDDDSFGHFGYANYRLNC